MNLLSPALLDAASVHPVMVGFSGGLDSTVLLHLLAQAPGRAAGSVRAVHVHHGLQAQADAWAEHCHQVCAGWGIALQVIHVDVRRDDGDGLEAAARTARHAAFQACLQAGEWLALAHHQDDQAETFLLRALRGSGVDGLAAMRPLRAFGHGQLWRPLLDVPRAALEAHARRHRLHWIEDPSNQHDEVDRNFLRLQLMPLLRQRWPHAATALARSAGLAAQASDLLATQDDAALQSCTDTSGALRIDALGALPDTAQARVLRRWVQQQGLPPLPGNGVRVIQQQLLSAGHDQPAEFRWQHARIRRWRGQLHVVPVLSPWPVGWQQSWQGDVPALLPDGGVLTLQGADRLDRPLLLRQRRGGERIHLPQRTHRHALKQCLQQSEVPPWLRPHLPLLCDGDDVLAAGDRIVSGTLQHWLQAHGARLHWQSPHPSN